MSTDPFALPASYTLSEEVPSLDDYLSLKKANGIPILDVEAAKRGLANTHFAVQLHLDGTCIGFARVISDHGVWYYLSDETIHPDHSSTELLGCMVAHLNRKFYEHSPPGGYMLAKTDNPDLYQQAGLNLLDPPEKGIWVNQPATPSEKVVFPKPSENLGEGYSVSYEMVDADTFLEFRRIGGLGVKDREAVEESIKRTAFAVQVYFNGECIAFCRNMGDGGLVHHMADGVVLPEHQAAGIGKFFVSRLIYEFYQTAAPGAHMLAFTWAPEFAIKGGFNPLPDNVVGLYAWQPTK